MRKIGLVGAVNWYAMSLYFNRINTELLRRTGGNCSPPIILESLDCSDLEEDLSDADSEMTVKLLLASAKRMEKAGATAILICANSMHKAYDQLSESIGIPILHIADAVGNKIKNDGRKSAALLGTSNVMAASWYRQKLVKQGVSLIPTDAGRVAEIDRIIREELLHGKVTRDAERTLKTFITNIDKGDVDAIILGAAELSRVVDTKANLLPIYDSIEIHADAGVDWILGDTP